MKIYLLLFIGFYCCSATISCAEKQKHKEKQHALSSGSTYLSQTQLTVFVSHTKPVHIAGNHFTAPFNALQFNKVIAYAFEGDEEIYPCVINNQTNRFNPVVVRQKELTKEQLENLVSFLTDSTTYGEGTAACFRPHLAVVFYQDNRMVYEVDVCLDCNYLQSTTPIPAAYTKKMKLENGAEIDLIGFSKKGIEKISKLMKETGLAN